MRSEAAPGSIDEEAAPGSIDEEAAPGSIDEEGAPDSRVEEDYFSHRKNNSSYSFVHVDWFSNFDVYREKDVRGAVYENIFSYTAPLTSFSL